MNDLLNELYEYSRKYNTESMIDIKGVLLPEDASLFFKKQIGGFNDYIWFISPYDDVWNEQVQEQKEIYEDLKEAYHQYGLTDKKGEGYPFDFYPQKNGIIPWAVCDNGALFFWKININSITIVVYGEDADYYEYDMTTTEFLYKLINNEIPEMIEFLPMNLFDNGIVCN